MPRIIHQILCTHCTHRTSYFQNVHKGSVSNNPFEYSARAGSIPAAESHRTFQRVETLLKFDLPAPLEMTRAYLESRNSKNTDRRLVYFPFVSGMRVVANIAYRTFDTSPQKRPGSYFAHVLFEKVEATKEQHATKQPNNFTWGPIQALELWGEPRWISEDSEDLPFEMPTLGNFAEFRTQEPVICEKLLLSFLTTPTGNGFDDPNGVIPDRWRDIPPADRQQFLIDLIEAYLVLDLTRRQRVVLIVEPAIAALLFYGAAKLLPRRGVLDEFSFSTLDASDKRPDAALSATCFLEPEKQNLPTKAREWASHVINTFRPCAGNFPWSQEGAFSYARTLVHLWTSEGWESVQLVLSIFNDPTLFPNAINRKDVHSILRLYLQAQQILGTRKELPNTTPPSPSPASSAHDQTLSLLVVREASRVCRNEQILASLKNDPQRSVQILKHLLVAKDGPHPDQNFITTLIDSLFSDGALEEQRISEVISSESIHYIHRIEILNRFVKRTGKIPSGSEEIWLGNAAAGSLRGLLADVLKVLPSELVTRLCDQFINDLKQASPQTQCQQQARLSGCLGELTQLAIESPSRNEHLAQVIGHPELDHTLLLKVLASNGKDWRRRVFQAYPRQRHELHNILKHWQSELPKTPGLTGRPEETFRQVLEILKDGTSCGLLPAQLAAEFQRWQALADHIVAFHALREECPTGWHRILEGSSWDEKANKQGELVAAAAIETFGESSANDRKGKFFQTQSRIIQHAGREPDDPFQEQFKAVLNGGKWSHVRYAKLPPLPPQVPIAIGAFFIVCLAGWGAVQIGHALTAQNSIEHKADVSARQLSATHTNATLPSEVENPSPVNSMDNQQPASSYHIAANSTLPDRFKKKFISKWRRSERFEQLVHDVLQRCWESPKMLNFAEELNYAEIIKDQPALAKGLIRANTPRDIKTQPAGKEKYTLKEDVDLLAIPEIRNRLWHEMQTWLKLSEPPPIPHDQLKYYVQEALDSKPSPATHTAELTPDVVFSPSVPQSVKIPDVNSIFDANPNPSVPPVVSPPQPIERTNFSQKTSLLGEWLKEISPDLNELEVEDLEDQLIPFITDQVRKSIASLNEEQGPDLLADSEDISKLRTTIKNKIVPALSEVKEANFKRAREIAKKDVLHAANLPSRFAPVPYIITEYPVSDFSIYGVSQLNAAFRKNADEKDSDKLKTDIASLSLKEESTQIGIEFSYQAVLTGTPPPEPVEIAKFYLNGNQQLVVERKRVDEEYEMVADLLPFLLVEVVPVEPDEDDELPAPRFISLNAPIQNSSEIIIDWNDRGNISQFNFSKENTHPDLEQFWRYQDSTTTNNSAYHNLLSLYYRDAVFYRNNNPSDIDQPDDYNFSQHITEKELQTNLSQLFKIENEDLPGFGDWLFFPDALEVGQTLGYQSKFVPSKKLNGKEEWGNFTLTNSNIERGSRQVLRGKYWDNPGSKTNPGVIQRLEEAITVLNTFSGKLVESSTKPELIDVKKLKDKIIGLSKGTGIPVFAEYADDQKLNALIDNDSLKKEITDNISALRERKRKIEAMKSQIIHFAARLCRVVECKNSNDTVVVDLQVFGDPDERIRQNMKAQQQIQ